jgi:glycosyltransferase involved in cell wall biosynthesis
MGICTSVIGPGGREKRRCIYFLTHDWAGLHDMFELQDWGRISGVPLVPLYWKGLADRGYEVHVFVCGAFRKQKSFLLQGIAFHLLRVPAWTMAGVQERRYMSWLKIAFIVMQVKTCVAIWKTARQTPPSFIYSYQSTFVPLGWAMSRKYKVPHALHLWGTWLGHYLLRVPWYRRAPAIGKILALKMPLDLLIISNDGTEGDRVVDKLGFPKEKFRFWMDGTSPNVLDPSLDTERIKEEIGLRRGDKMILQVARLDAWKRIDRTICAMPEVLRHVPNARLVIAGDGHLRDELENLAHRCGVMREVMFLGHVPHTRVLHLHNAADLFVTVQDLTNLGNQIMEAMHSKTCIIALDVGGTSQIVLHDKTGWLLQGKDIANLAKVIVELLENDALRIRLADSAYKFAKENIWTWDKRIAIEVREIEELMEAACET